MGKKVIGIDYGSDSARAVLVDVEDGRILSTVAALYPRWTEGKYCDPAASSFRQHPLDYVEVLHKVLNGVLEGCDCKDEIVGIGVDTTASTPALTDAEGTPLALKEKFAENPDAMFVLWKDHTGTAEAKEIVKVFGGGSVNYCETCGGDYSAENIWSKVLHIIKTNPEVAQEAHSVIELCDYIPSVLIGKRSTNAYSTLGYKALWAKKWGGLPAEELYAELGGDKFVEIRNSMDSNPRYGTEVVGTLCKEWADELGLSQDVVVSAGVIDSLAGAVGAGCSPGKMALNMGTSACLIAVDPDFKDGMIEGVFGQFPDGVIPGMMCFEMGLSSFGDNFAWLKRFLAGTMKTLLKGLVSDEVLEKAESQILPSLAEAAAALPFREDAPFATDWFNGRRSPAPNPSIRATVGGLGLATNAAEVYYAIVEATAFGVKAMVDTLLDGGVALDSLTAIGGIAVKSPFIVQKLADVLGIDIFVPNLTQACGLGAAINASVAAGCWPDLIEAQKAMCVTEGTKYTASSAIDYSSRYSRYNKLK